MPPVVPDLRAKVAAGLLEITDHASKRAIRRSIGLAEIRDALSQATLLEDYPNDKYGPSCLMLGFTPSGRPLHILCSYPTRPKVMVITVYEPDPALWINHETRR